MYVDYTVEIDFLDKFKPDFLNLLTEAEESDRSGDEVNYYSCVEAIDMDAKLMCSNGLISTYQWDALMRRYRYFPLKTP